MEEELEQLKKMRSEAEEIFRRCLRAVDPFEAVKGFIHVEGDRLILGTKGHPKTELNLTEFDRISLVGAGKATAPMARAIEDLLGERIQKGIINVKYGFTEDLAFTEVIEAGHPVPDENGEKGTQKILDLLYGASEKDLIFSVISGGGSALLPHPVENITLLEKQEITRQLLACGASIDEINAVRKHIASSKGGQMARAAFPATIVNLMLSDVVGDKMDVIASGPFVPDSSTFKDVEAIFKKYDLEDVPTSIREHLKAGLEGRIPETPKEDDAIFNLARGIELVYGLKRALDILEEPLDQGAAQTAYTPQDGEGYGLVEAPRGPLIHRYVIEKGHIAEAEFVIPTVHNVMAIERALRVAAQRYVNAERIDMELEHAVGRVVRAFDPCVSCATH